jgi:hypothetical protein
MIEYATPKSKGSKHSQTEREKLGLYDSDLGGGGGRCSSSVIKCKLLWYSFSWKLNGILQIKSKQIVTDYQ